MVETHEQLAMKRQEECEIYTAWLQKRIGLLSCFNWLTVLVPSLLAVTAGSALFAGAEWGPAVAGAALLAAVLSAIHKGLNCDIHQADCRRLLKAYRALSKSYRTLNDIELSDCGERLLVLEEELGALSKTDSVTTNAT